MNGDALSSLIYFLAFGGLFYWMMKRGGCGMHGHGGHGAHGSHRQHGDGGGGGHSPNHISAQVLDPVCGMKLDPGGAAATRVIGGRIFYLCSEQCVATFDRDPHRYGSFSGHE